MRITEKQLRRIIRECLRERYEREDFQWEKEKSSGDVIEMLRGADLPKGVSQQRMDQVLDALAAKEKLSSALASPKNRKKIEDAVKRGQMASLLDALEGLVIKSRSN